MNKDFELRNLNFRITENTVIPYIDNQYLLELEHDKVLNQSFWGAYLDSPIFDVGRSRGGDAPYGGPFWADFEYDHYYSKLDWNSVQICGHQQGQHTGLVRTKDGIACLDSRAIFEYYPETHFIKPSDINDEKTKAEISEEAWKGATIRYRESSEESE